MWRKGGKRLFDLTAALLLLVVLFPLMLLLASLVRVKLGSPVFFVQQRPGKDARPFSMFKFRTMSNKRDANGALLPDAQRLGRFGAFLRSTSLDELPELWNVVRGEMSLVGPRPLLMHYLPRYSPEQMRRHEVPPGITGLSQVNGRNALTWPQKFAFDIFYVDHQSFWGDLQILAKTVNTVFMCESITFGSSATMPEFMGNHPDEST